MSNEKNIDTEILLKALESSDTYDEFFNENEPHLGVDDFKLALRKFCSESKKEILKVIEDASISCAYGYQLFNGTRKPSRDKVIQLAIAMELPLKKVNHLLKCAQKQPLYAKSRRDSIIIYAITHKLDILSVNKLLIDNDMISF